MQDHVVVCGYGTKGRSAVRALRQRDIAPDQIVVVETDPDAIRQAASDGLVTVQGSSTSDAVMREAEVGKARAVIVAVSQDDTAVLTTLTIRQLAPDATVVAAVRESENADLLTQSGADSVITSSDAAGRLLGLATDSPRAVAVVEDLIAVGTGLDLLERDVTPDEVGRDPQSTGAPVLAVVRGGRDPSLRPPGVHGARSPGTGWSMSAATPVRREQCPRTSDGGAPVRSRTLPSRGNRRPGRRAQGARPDPLQHRDGARPRRDAPRPGRPERAGRRPRPVGRPGAGPEGHQPALAPAGRADQGRVAAPSSRRPLACSSSSPRTRATPTPSPRRRPSWWRSARPSASSRSAPCCRGSTTSARRW